jgi:hypothetical protein
MPYEILKQPDNGFKVCKRQPGPKECYSKRGLPYPNALGQMRAIIISEMNRASSKKTSKKVSKKTSKKPSKKVKKSSKKNIKSSKKLKK